MIRISRADAPLRVSAKLGADAIKITLAQTPLRLDLAPTAGPPGPRGEVGPQGASGAVWLDKDW